MATKTYLDVEDLEVYSMLCQLHIDVCDFTHQWPSEEKYELGSQARRSLNSALKDGPYPNRKRHQVSLASSCVSVFPDT